LGNERQLGTNLNHVDTDNDGHYDSDEITPGQRRVTDGLVGGAIGSNISDSGYADVSSPFDPDSDDDGLLDGVETYTWGSNPANAFTDIDDTALNDGQEVAVGRDPRVNDKRVTINANNISGNTPSSTSNVTAIASAIIGQGPTFIVQCNASAFGNSYTAGFSSSSVCGPRTVIVRQGEPGYTINVSGTASQLFGPVVTDSVSAGSSVSLNYDTAVASGITIGLNLGVLSGTTGSSTMNIVFTIDLNLD
jgi:hypothetical protein